MAVATPANVGDDVRMRRADRLFLIIHALRGRRTALQARQLAQTLGVSLRTVYRDVADLQLSGVPIEGEAGVGYVLRKGSDIPPLMFSADELEALVVGTRFVRAFAGVRLAESAKTALLKIEAVLPPDLRERAARTRIFAPVWRDQHQSEFAAMIDRLHAAIVAQPCVAAGLSRRERTQQCARDRAVMPVVLGWRMDAGCVVPAAAGLPKFSPGPHRRTASRPAKSVRNRPSATWMLSAGVGGSMMDHS
jgi:biotin operon repressor